MIIGSKKLSIKEAISIYYVGDKDVGGAKATIDKIIQSFSQESFKSRYIIHNLQFTSACVPR